MILGKSNHTWKTMKSPPSRKMGRRPKRRPDTAELSESWQWALDSGGSDVCSQHGWEPHRNCRAPGEKGAPLRSGTKVGKGKRPPGYHRVCQELFTVTFLKGSILRRMSDVLQVTERESDNSQPEPKAGRRCGNAASVSVPSGSRKTHLDHPQLLSQ